MTGGYEDGPTTRDKLLGLQNFPEGAWDDVTGAALDTEKVKIARRLEIECVEKKPV